MFGDYREYYSNGNIYIECKYGKNGKLDGEYKEYDPTGKLVKEAVYVDGKC